MHPTIRRWISTTTAAATARSPLGYQLDALSDQLTAPPLSSNSSETRAQAYVDALRPLRELSELQRRVLLLSHFAARGWRDTTVRKWRVLLGERVSKPLSDAAIGKLLGLTKRQVQHLRETATRQISRTLSKTAHTFL